MSVGPFFDRVVTAVGRHLVIDRTALEQRLAPVAPGIECSPSGTAGAWTDELLANMFARLYPRMVVFGDDRTAEACRSLARSINPDIELTEDPRGATLVVSTAAKSTTATTLAVGCRGWTVYMAGDAPPDAGADRNVFAAAVAAALAARIVFGRLVLQIGEAEGPLRWNLLSLRDDDSSHVAHDIELGELLIAGVGAVGNAAIWCLRRHTGLHGSAWVIDPQNVELSNLQRYVLAVHGDVGLSKTMLAERELDASGLRVRRIEGQLGAVPIPEQTERILVSVDNEEGRRVAQSLLPRLVVNGWTSATGAGASWHDFAMGRGCLACVYHREGPLPSESDIVADEIGLTPLRVAQLLFAPGVLTPADLAVVAAHLGRPIATLGEWVGKPLRECHRSLVCGAQAVPLGRGDAEAVVPLAHQSVLAGALAAAELVKRSSPRLAALAARENAVAWEDLARPPPTIWTRHYNNKKGCICRDRDYREVHGQKWRSSKS